MTKSDLIDLMASEQSNLSERDVEFAVKAMLQQMSDALASGERIEIRGFGSYKLHFRPPRIGRNPKTGGTVALPAKVFYEKSYTIMCDSSSIFWKMMD